jgi:hypothetical protein
VNAWNLLGQVTEVAPQQMDTNPAAKFIASILGLGLFVLVYLIARKVLAGSRPQTKPISDLEPIEIDSLTDRGPPDSGPELEVYHVPVRLALIVLAPLGRESRLPESGELPLLVDRFLPGLMRVLSSHQPRFEAWPPQLSSGGFVQAFFTHAKLPGNRGMGTPWCSLAGKALSAHGPFLMGLVCRAGHDIDLGQMTIDHVAKWRDVVTVAHRQ